MLDRLKNPLTPNPRKRYFKSYSNQSYGVNWAGERHKKAGKFELKMYQILISALVKLAFGADSYSRYLLVFEARVAWSERAGSDGNKRHSSRHSPRASLDPSHSRFENKLIATVRVFL